MCKLRKVHDLKIPPSTKFRLLPAAVCGEEGHLTEEGHLRGFGVDVL